MLTLSEMILSLANYCKEYLYRILYHWNDRHDISASFYYLDEIRWFSGGTTRPSFEKLDLRYAYLISRASDTRIELIGQNLLEDYTDYRAENTAEKTFLLRFSSGF